MILAWIKRQTKQTWAIAGVILCALLAVSGYYIWQHYFSLSRYHIQTTQSNFTINHWVTSQGATVVFVPLAELPILDVVMLFPAGSAYDGDHFGVAQLTSQMIGQSTKTMDTQAIHEAFESVGAIFSTAATKDYASIRLRTLTDTAVQKQAIKTLATVLKDTTFKPADFSREQSRLLTVIDSMKQSANSVASETFSAELYGSHPYGHPVYGTKQSVASLQVEALDAFYREHFHQSDAVLTLVGNITLREATSLADELLAQLPAQGKARGIPPVDLIKPEIKTIAFPSSQTHVIWGMPVMAQGNPDYFAFSLGNHLLGASPLNSLLFDVIREKAGLAYNVGSGLAPMEQLGPFLIKLQTRNAQAAEAINLMKVTLQGFLTNPIDATKLKASKDNLKGQFLLGLASNAEISSFVATLAYYHLPWDYAQQYVHQIDAVTPEQIQAVFNKYVHPAEFSLTTVGETP